MEVIPGKQLGIYVIGQDLYDVIKTLDCDFKYENRHTVSVLSTKSNYFIFNWTLESQS